MNTETPVNPLNNEQYVYAVTRVHIAEQRLLSRQDMEQLLTAASPAEALRLLADKGWGGAETPADDIDALVAAETAKTWDLIEELAGEVEPFNVFRYANDFHNLKAAIKLAYTANDEKDQSHYFMPYGTVEIDRIRKAAAEHDFSKLPDAMAEAGRDAYEVLARTGNGQLCDMAIDRAALAAIDKAGRNASSEVLRRYAAITVDGANIKAAVRCGRMGKSREFIERALAPAGTLDAKRLGDAAAQGPEAIYSYLFATPYAGAVEALKTSMAAFERWCDDEMIRMIRPQRTNYFGIEPLAAFILGRENEIRMVRLIVSAKVNHLSTDALRERLRETYV